MGKDNLAMENRLFWFNICYLWNKKNRTRKNLKNKNKNKREKIGSKISKF